jgi:hypothetical protein
VSATAGKRKEERETRAAAAKGGMGRWAAEPKEQGEVLFLKSFSNQTISIQIQIKYFQTFSQHFINFLDFTQATKNHA